MLGAAAYTRRSNNNQATTGCHTEARAVMLEINADLHKL